MMLVRIVVGIQHGEMLDSRGARCCSADEEIIEWSLKNK